MKHKLQAAVPVLCRYFLNLNEITVAAKEKCIIRVPKVPFRFFLINQNMKLEIKFWFSFLYCSWDRKHQNRWFSDFQNNWTLKFKFEVCFSLFIFIWKTKNQIYLNKCLMKLVTMPLTQSQWASIKELNSFRDQRSNFRK